MRKDSIGTSLLTTALILLLNTPSSCQSWTFGANMNISRAGVAVAVGADGKIYAFGGNIIGDPDMTTVTEAYDITLNQWAMRAPMPTARTSLAVARAFNGKIYAFGGCPESHGYGGVTTVEAYDPATDTWSKVTPMAVGRTGHKAITGLDGRIYVIGGHNIPLGHLTSLEIYDPATDTWTVGAPMTVARQQFGAVLGKDGRIYVIGGSDQWRTGLMGTVEIYDPATNTWSLGTRMPTSRDGVGTAVGPNGEIYAVGGFARELTEFGDVTATVERFDPITNTWMKINPLLSATYAPGTVTGPDCRVYAIGGGGYGVSGQTQILTLSMKLKRPSCW